LMKGRSDLARKVRISVLAAVAALSAGFVAYEYAGRVLFTDLRSRVASDARQGDFAAAEKKVRGFQTWFPLVARKRMGDAQAAFSGARASLHDDRIRAFVREEARVLDAPVPEAVEQAQSRLQARLENEGELLTEAGRKALDDLVSRCQEFRLRWARLKQVVKDGEHEKGFRDYQSFVADYPGFRPGANPPLEPVLVPFSAEPPGTQVSVDGEPVAPSAGKIAFRIGRETALRAACPGFASYEASLELRAARWPLEIRLEKEVAWRADLGVAVEVAPVLSINEVQVSTRDGAWHGFELPTGARRWRAPGVLRGDPDHAPALRADGLLVFCGRDRSLHTVRPGEGGRTRRPLDAVAAHSPVLFDRQEFSGALLGLANGRVVLAPWDAGPPRLLFQTDRPLAGGVSEYQGVILAGDVEGRLYAFDVIEGRFKWREAVLQGALTAPPLVHQGFVYAGTSAGKIYAVDLAEGFLVPGWPYSGGSPLLGPPVIYGDLLLIGSEDGYVHAIDRAKGVFYWKVKAGEALGSPITVNADFAYVGTLDGRLCALDLQSRAVKWSFRTGGPVRAAPLVAGGLIVAGSADGMLYAIRE
ncbi:MAG: PQQ-binding-like beta-propeller repeat protein, partial [Planctomycetes bacterium]|nr:PQQ-binding-like beta-propeller repeat protein [Planctomycetota bacterium]